MVWPLAGEAGTPTSLHRRPRVLAQGESPSHTPRDDARTRIRSDASFSSPFYTHTRRTSVRGFRTFHMIINGPAGLPPSRRSWMLTFKVRKKCFPTKERRSTSEPGVQTPHFRRVNSSRLSRFSLRSLFPFSETDAHRIRARLAPRFHLRFLGGEG